MAKLTLNDIAGQYASTTELNNNFALIETALENTLSRDGTTPNTMSADLDMNSNDLNNVSVVNAGSVLVAGSSIVPGDTLVVPSATNVPNTPAGNISSTNVQDALNELDTEYDDFTALRAVTTGAGIASVKGYDTDGDGGGGIFYWDSASTETDNDGTIIKATSITTGRWKRIYNNTLDVKWFGAKGDGTTDDSTAMQNAIDASYYKTLIMSDGGTYKVSTTLTVINTIKISAGPMRQGGSLYWTGGASAVLHVTSAADNVHIDGVQFDNAGTATVGLQVDCVRFLIERVFANPAVAFSTAVIQTDLTGTVYHGVLRDCAIHSSAVGEENPIGFYGARGHTIIVDNCMFSGCLRGIVAGGAASQTVAGFSIINTRIECFGGVTPGYPGGTTAIGIDVVNVQGLNISGCSFEMAADAHATSTNQRAIKLQEVGGGNISGSYLSGTGVATSAINVADVLTTGVTISGNDFYNFNGNGIEVNGTGKLYNLEINANRTSGGTSKVYDDTIVPALTFGGGSTGLTYSVQLGRWKRTGDFMIVQGVINLTNKGTSTGVVRITGLPLASQNITSLDSTGSVVLFNVASVSGNIESYLQPNSSEIRLYYLGTGAQTELTDANFANNTALSFQITYPVDRL